MPFPHDLPNQIKAKPGFLGAAADADGPLISITGFSGKAKLILYAAESDSQAVTKKIDVTVHNVLSDSEATAAGNQVAAFTQIIGRNDTGVDPDFEEIAVDLDNLDPAKPYLQVKVALTSAWAGTVAVVPVLGGYRVTPIPSGA